MTGATSQCSHVRRQIGGDPHNLPPDVVEHLATCAECTRFRDETLRLDGRLKAALELPLAEFRKQSAPPRTRRYAMAASILFGVLLAGSLWVANSRPALADQVVDHVLEEGGSWDSTDLLPPDEVAEVLRTAGVHFDASLRVIYAYPCPFHGHRVAHMVVQTDNGPMTVMLLPHEKIGKRTEFSESGLHGVLFPAGEGSVAVLMRNGELPQALVDQILSATRM